MEKFDENMRVQAKGMHENGYKYLIFITGPDGANTHFFTKTSMAVGPIMREDWPNHTIASVWNLDSVFARP